MCQKKTVVLSEVIEVSQSGKRWISANNLWPNRDFGAGLGAIKIKVRPYKRQGLNNPKKSLRRIPIFTDKYNGYAKKTDKKTIFTLMSCDSFSTIYKSCRYLSIGANNSNRALSVSESVSVVLNCP
ncbi:MAG: hypothetical protein DRR08_08835 [Candidatus Parabeggiatoa sp. nov. 2]|nr:MAG: hypothetical protein DRR08_08835 [Gammaproteobacteria bacterium]